MTIHVTCNYCAKVATKCGSSGYGIDHDPWIKGWITLATFHDRAVDLVSWDDYERPSMGEYRPSYIHLCGDCAPVVLELIKPFRERLTPAALPEDDDGEIPF